MRNYYGLAGYVKMLMTLFFPPFYLLLRYYIYNIYVLYITYTFRNQRYNKTIESSTFYSVVNNNENYRV